MLLYRRRSYQIQGLYWLYSVSCWEELPVIWHVLYPLNREKMRNAAENSMSAAAIPTSYNLFFLSHPNNLLIVGLTFIARNTNILTNITIHFLFLDLPLDDGENISEIACQ